MTTKVCPQEEFAAPQVELEAPEFPPICFKEIFEELLPKAKAEKKEEPLDNPLALTPMPPAPFTPIVLTPIIMERGGLEVEAIFHQMVEKITHIHEAGLTTTTVTLPENTNSLLSGTEITLIEYNTAPKDYNICIKGSPEATTLFQAHLGELISAFNTEYRPFKINRLELSLHSKRRPEASKKKELEEDDGTPLPLG